MYGRVALAPIWMGAAVAAALLAVFAALAWAFGGLEQLRAGETDLWEYREARLAFVVAALAGYIPAASRYVALGARSNLRELRTWLRAPEGGFAALEERFARLEPWPVRRAALLGLAAVPLTALLIDRDPGLYLRPGYWQPENGFAWVVGAFVGWSLGVFVYVTLTYARRFSALAPQLVDADLLGQRVFAPFARQGLRCALLWLVLISLVSLNALDFVWFAVTAVVALAAGTTALILPVRGAHGRLREMKREELDRVDAAIRGEPGALGGSVLDARAADLGLADLLAWRGYVESVREWPFDFPILLRFALYLGIPLGSWLGGALVERLLGAALD